MGKTCEEQSNHCSGSIRSHDSSNGEDRVELCHYHEWWVGVSVYLPLFSKESEAHDALR